MPACFSGALCILSFQKNVGQTRAKQKHYQKRRMTVKQFFVAFEIKIILVKHRKKPPLNENTRMPIIMLDDILKICDHCWWASPCL